MPQFGDKFQYEMHQDHPKVKKMSQIFDRVWALWPDIDTMAASLEESPHELKRARRAGQLPDKRHHRLLLARATWTNTPLKYEHLQRERERNIPVEASVKERRSVQIGELYDALGGREVVADNVGMSRNALKIAKARGRLPMAKKFEFVEFAKGRGVTIDMRLFDAITAKQR